jgi:drug/metabolite transporter (DMT)-like permease
LRRAEDTVRLTTRPARYRGAILGLLAAALFGASAPVAQRLLSASGPLMLAGLLYLGAGAGISVYRWLRPSTEEAGLRRADAKGLFGVVVFGGVLGPVLMLVGLGRVTAIAGSLLLNLEAVFTILVAALFFREHIGRYVVGALILIVGGALVLKLEPGDVGADTLGVLCVTAACFCWALDNNLTQRLTLRDPFRIVQVKALGAGAFNLLLALWVEHSVPRYGVVLSALGLGCISYGLSVVLDAYALRAVGAAREAAYFATAPFVGALAATVIVGEHLRGFDWVAMAAMAAGVVFLLSERHSHQHAHEALEHDHMHTHDEHHQHVHQPSDPSGEPHAHPHRHVRLVHEHPHVPDLHHRHGHG